MLGTVDAYRRDDGAVEITKADPLIAVSIELLAQWLTPDAAPHARVADGMVWLSGVGPDGQPVEYRYRAVGFQAANAPTAEAQGLSEGERLARLDMTAYDALKANEGGFILCERIT